MLKLVGRGGKKATTFANENHLLHVLVLTWTWPMFTLLKDFAGNLENGQTNVDIGRGFKVSPKT